MATTFDPRDLQHEEGIQRNPYDIKIWLAYLLAKNGAPAISRYVIYERALKFLPRSYKLWHAYLQERTAALNNQSINDKRYGILINTYERALVNMHRMPRIW
jgi:pre-mRNA-splicing factor SYF1